MPRHWCPQAEVEDRASEAAFRRLYLKLADELIPGRRNEPLTIGDAGVGKFHASSAIMVSFQGSQSPRGTRAVSVPSPETTIAEILEVGYASGHRPPCFGEWDGISGLCWRLRRWTVMCICLLVQGTTLVQSECQ